MARVWGARPRRHAEATRKTEAHRKREAAGAFKRLEVPAVTRQRLVNALLFACLPLLATVPTLSLSGCGGSTASYTRFRREAAAGRAPAPTEIRPSDFVAYHAQADVPRPSMSSGPERSVTMLDAALGNPHLPSYAPSQPLLEIALRGGAASVRYPAYVVVVLDVSGSMQDGDKIGAVRHALARFVETLDPMDRIAIVTFADDAHVALPPARVGDARSSVLGAISQLRAYGGTNLEAGLRRGLELAYAGDVEPSSVVRLVLLSDGIPSVGVVSGASIVELARRRDAREAPITVVGMGDQIDYALLDAIGRESGGAFHYLDQPREVERLFSTELRALTEVAARDVRVRVRLPAGWSLARALDERTRFEGRDLVTPLGDLGGDEASVVALELAAPASPHPEQIEVQLEYLDGTGSVAILAHTRLSTTRDGALPYVDVHGGTMLRNAALARAALALRDAGVLRARGDALGAQRELVRARAEICDARARLWASGEPAHASSLDEVAQLIAGIAPTASGSGAFAGWRQESGGGARVSSSHMGSGASSVCEVDARLR